ncbi:PREDICTED: calcium-activated chloride channel regulator 4-like [Nicrophorus vespilloides]|uniref:Calcium-activated chloride channel regulator 4-like n=1 Tax=Nicrophorus vespilloides TaxID=110193 RepID=A0ABM1N7C0_NICVS|nr:PREDICTED: calcium-activated chloride channel regulator 4-like [Nicrophorus vespilloides]
MKGFGLISTVILVVSVIGGNRGLEMKNGAYEDFVVTVSESVPVTDCEEILNNLEATLTSASKYLFSALDSRAFIRSATVLLPATWPDTCVPSTKWVTSGSGETSDVTVQATGPTRGRLWTQQSAGCGMNGDQIYLGYEALEQKDDSLARSLVKEFAMYRYGVFEEQGYFNDPIYPICYNDDSSQTLKVSGCSDLPISDNGICDGSSKDYNTTKMVDERARVSIMFAPEAESVSLFCDTFNHDSYAPTKHNLMCERKSTSEVIFNHSDFSSENLANHSNSYIINTTPLINYKRHNITRFVLVIENSKDMVQRESWDFLRKAIRKWSFELPENVEAGLVMTNGSGATKFLNLVQMKLNNRDLFSSAIPYNPIDSSQTPCLHCGIKEAVDMLNAQKSPASNVIIVIAPGMNWNNNLKIATGEAADAKIRITTINYPDLIRDQSLDSLAKSTGGISYTVIENKVNVDNSLLTTYFQLSNVLYNIIENYCDDNLPMEIHRREIRNDRNSITGSFVLDENMGEPASLKLYTHNNARPMIKNLVLTSPSQEVFSRYSDSQLTYNVMTIIANISEPGTWTYTIEPYPGNPQPHILQVMATPKSKFAKIVRARFWTSPKAPLILYAEIKHGDYPVMGAKVEVLVTKSETNGTIIYNETFELLDTGSGDPDITKGDGIYTRYFSATAGGPGLYTFQVTTSDNGNTAYSWMESSSNEEGKPCCGSTIRTSNVETINPFQRVLPPKTLEITSQDILAASQANVGRIGDLKVQVVPEDMKARLSWTSPDMGGHNVARYEVKYAYSLKDIVDGFDTAAIVWEKNRQPLSILPPGSDTPFTIDMSNENELLDKPLYFAVRAYAHADSKPGAISNWVRVLVPSPPPPPTVPTSFTTNESSWPFQVNTGISENTGPSISKSMSFGIEIILPIVIGIIFLIIILILYCYFCVVKRKERNDHKSQKTDKLNSTITIVPSSPANMPINNQETYADDYPDHHAVGIPVNNYAYEDEPKKRYSLVQQQEQQLIEELKQQQIQRDQMNGTPNNYGALSVISSNTLQRGHTLSPYNSWSATQLLHEHERRQSPMEHMLLQDEQHQDALSQLEHMSIHLPPQQIPPEHYMQGHVPPPVPPLPAFNQNGYPVNYQIYGVQQPPQQQPIYQTMQRTNETIITAAAPFNPSLQGSMSSVNSGEKKRRNVTMV